MKPTTLLLAASLIANVALVSAYYVSRPTVASAGAAAASSAPGAIGERSASASRTANASDIASASAAETARDAALGRAFARFAEKMHAAQAASAGDGKWWRGRSGSGNLSREQMAQARRELSEAMIAAFGDDLGIGGVDNSRFAFLPAEKRDKLRSILGDYDELMAKFGAQGGIQLASDKEKLKLLTSERNRDIAALLSPEELADYEMRTSSTANNLRNRYGDGIATEDEFRKIYALQKAFDDKFSLENFNGRLSPEQMKARSDAAAQLQTDLRAAIGDDAYAALRRATDNDLKQVDALAARLNLPPDTTDRVAATRDTYAAESQRIAADRALAPEQRREQLQALATRAKADLTSTLGAEAADAYAQRSQWVSMLQAGMGYSTTPPANSPGALTLGGGGPSIYPVVPAMNAASGASRQVFNYVSTGVSSGGSAPGGAPVIFSGSDDSQAGGARIVAVTSTATFTPAENSTTAAAPSSPAATTAPPPANPTTTTPPATPPKP